MISKGAPDEKYTVLKWHLVIRIHELIDFLASDSNKIHFKSYILPLSEVLNFNTSHEIDSEVIRSMKGFRKVQPILVAIIQNEFWVIDGNHRLRKKILDGDTDCEVVIVPNELLYGYCQPFMEGGSRRRVKRLLEDIKIVLEV